MKQIDNKIIAEEGKVFRRIEDGMIYGSEITLGLTYYINGKRKRPAHQDVPEDFEEIDDQSELTDTEALEIIVGK